MQIRAFIWVSRWVNAAYIKTNFSVLALSICTFKQQLLSNRYSVCLNQTFPSILQKVEKVDLCSSKGPVRVPTPTATP